MAEDALSTVDPMPAAQQAKRRWRPWSADMPRTAISELLLRAIHADPEVMLYAARVSVWLRWFAWAVALAHGGDDDNRDQYGGDWERVFHTACSCCLVFHAFAGGVALGADTLMMATGVVHGCGQLGKLQLRVRRLRGLCRLSAGTRVWSGTCNWFAPGQLLLMSTRFGGS